MSEPDTIFCRNAISEAKRCCYPVIERLTANGVYVTISPNGAMNNIVGIDMAEQFIAKYIERHKED